MAIKFDHTTDYSGKELFSFLHNVSVPEFIKQADVAVESDVPLQKEAYADQSFRAFPINTAENTYLSYVHFFNKKAAIAHEYGDSHVKSIEQKIKVAADIYEITPHLETYAKEQKAKLSKTASSKDIGFVKVGNSVLSTYSYTTAEDLSKVAEVFVEDLNMFSFADRRSIAVELVKSAQEEGIDEIPDKVAKYAGYGFLDRDMLNIELFRRKAKFKFAEEIDKTAGLFSASKLSPEEKTKYDEMLKTHGARKAVEHYFKHSDSELAKKLRAQWKQKEAFEQIENDFKCNDVFTHLKAAQDLHELETAAGFYFNDKVATNLGDFVDRVFMTAEKVAELIDDVIYLGKDAFAKDDLENVSAAVYKQAFDMDVDPTKIADYKDELATMPASDVSLFRTLANI